jgi:hypothetical protein
LVAFTQAVIQSLTGNLITPGEGGEVIAPGDNFPSILKAGFVYNAYTPTQPPYQVLVYVVGGITYFDIFKNRHITTVCFVFGGVGGSNLCPKNNGME